MKTLMIDMRWSRFERYLESKGYNALRLHWLLHLAHGNPHHQGLRAWLLALRSIEADLIESGVEPDFDEFGLPDFHAFYQQHQLHLIP